MNITENLELLATTKENIRQAINDRGGSLETSTPFSAYPEAISSVGANDLIDLIEGDAVTFDIPSGTTAIAPYKFYAMNSLTAVTIPDTVTSIGNSAFYACDRLASVTIPDSVTSIGDYSFGSCYSLGDSLTIPDSVTSIGSNAFNGCENIVNLTIGSSVTSIGASAFNGCFGLTSVTIPASVSTIGSNAFNACRWLESITCFAATPPALGSGAFNLTNDCPIYVPAASVEDYKAAWSDYESRIEAIQVPTVNSALYDAYGNLINECDVEELRLSSFEGMSTAVVPNIYKLVVGSSVTAITDNPEFNRCSNLTVLDFSNATSLQSIGENFVSNSAGASIEAKRSDPDSEFPVVVIPEGVTSIGNNAFNSANVRNLDLPSTITNLGTYVADTVVALRATTPPTSEGSAFDEMASLYVPDDRMSYYEQEYSFMMPGAIQGLSNLQWTNE